MLRERAVLPSHVRVFWWISVAIVVYWTFSIAWFWLVTLPSDHYLALLQRLPPALREPLYRAAVIRSVVPAAFWSVFILGMAWLATFRRQNWARWIYALLFLFRELLPPLFSLAYMYLDLAPSAAARHIILEDFWKSTVSEWSNPRSYVTPVLAIAAIVAVFTGDAKDWFRKPMPPVL